MNPNPSIQTKTEWWNDRMAELTYLVCVEGYRLKELAIHFNRSAGAIASMLHRREISLVGMRYRYLKELSND